MQYNRIQSEVSTCLQLTPQVPYYSMCLPAPDDPDDSGRSGQPSSYVTSLAWSDLPPSLTLAGFTATIGPFPRGPLAGRTHVLELPPAADNTGLPFSWDQHQQSLHLRGDGGTITSLSSGSVSVSSDSQGFTFTINLLPPLVTTVRSSITMATAVPVDEAVDGAAGTVLPHASARALHWASSTQQELPHVNECNCCFKCVVDASPGTASDEAYEEKDTGRRVRCRAAGRPLIIGAESMSL